MADDDSTLQTFQKQDSEGFTFNVGKCTLANGEYIDCPPEFRQLKTILDTFDELGQRDDDVWLASYSKAGTHWMYEILHLLMTGSSTPSETYKGVSMIEHSSGIDFLNQLPSPRILNSHMRVKYLPPQILKKQKIIHVARNPKSVAVSYYFHTKIGKMYEYNGTFGSYLPTYLQGYHTLYGNWFEYMQEWHDFAKGNNNVYLVFYEDLKEDPEKEIRKLATFLGFNYDDDFISNVAKLTAFDAMKLWPKKQAHNLEISSTDDTGKPRFMRKGSIQDWKNHFTVAENEMFDEMYNKKMVDYGDLKARIRFQ